MEGKNKYFKNNGQLADAYSRVLTSQFESSMVKKVIYERASTIAGFEKDMGDYFRDKQTLHGIGLEGFDSSEVRDLEILLKSGIKGLELFFEILKKSK